MLKFCFICQKPIIRNQFLSKTQNLIPPSAVGCAVGFKLTLIQWRQRSGDARGQLFDCMPSPKPSSTQECDKDRHLKNVKLILRKKF